MYLGQFGKIGTANDALTQSGETFAGVVVGHAFLRFNEDVTRARLLDRWLFVATTLVE